MKSLPATPSSILPDRPSDVGKGQMNDKVGTPPGLSKIRASSDWKKGAGGGGVVPAFVIGGAPAATIDVVCTESA